MAPHRLFQHVDGDLNFTDGVAGVEALVGHLGHIVDNGHQIAVANARHDQVEKLGQPLVADGRSGFPIVGQVGTGERLSGLGQDLVAFFFKQIDQGHEVSPGSGTNDL